MPPTDSNGNYSLPASYHVQNGDTVLPVQHNPPFEDVANALSNRLMADGRKVMTGNLQMGANRIIGAGAGRGNDDVATIRQVGRKAAFDTVADLLADNSVGYASATVIVSPGDIIEAQGFRYEVVAGDATDAWLIENGNGVKLKVLPNAGELNVLAWGPVLDLMTNVSPIILSWLKACEHTGRVGYAPSGVYTLGNPDADQIVIDLSSNLTIRGDGDTTIFRRADGVLSGTNQRMLRIGAVSGASVSVAIKDILLDGNSDGNPIPIPVGSVVGTFAVGETVSDNTTGASARIVRVEAGTLWVTDYLNPPSIQFTDGNGVTGATSGATAVLSATVDSFVWQQSHSLTLQSLGLRAFKSVRVENVTLKHPTADGFSCRGSSDWTFGNIVVKGVKTEGVRGRVRGDVTITAPYDTLDVSGLQVDQFVIEVNQPSTGHDCYTTIDGVIAQQNFTCYLTSHWNAGIRAKLKASNIIAKGILIFGEFDAEISNFDFATTIATRLIYGRWKFDGGKFYWGLNGAAYPDNHGIRPNSAAAAPDKIIFSDVEFDGNPAATALDRHFYDENFFRSTQEITEFINCEFRGSTVRTATLRSGCFRFKGCRHYFPGPAVLGGTTNAAGVTNELFFEDNWVDHASGYLYQPGTAGNQVSIWMKGNASRSFAQLINFTRYDHIAAPRGSGSLLLFRTVDDLEAGSTPDIQTGKLIRGQRIWRTAPSPTVSMGWTVTVSGNGDGSAATGAPDGATFTNMPALP